MTALCFDLGRAFALDKAPLVVHCQTQRRFIDGCAGEEIDAGKDCYSLSLH